MITIYTIKNNKEWGEVLYNKLLEELPPTDKHKYSNFSRWQDRQSGILGKLLLKRGIRELGSDAQLQDLHCEVYQKPYFDEGPKFNISHSGLYVVCAVSATEVIGIDIEHMLPDIRPTDFKSCLTADEWAEWCISIDRIHWFYDFWTKKEAVMKGDGRGMDIALDEILLMNDSAWLAGTCWRLYPLAVDNDYSCHLASLCPVSPVIVPLTLDSLTHFLAQ